ncbi:MAG: 3-methyl-2-oxobutanoate dehydrogenase subunit beta [bacterium]
MKTTIPKEEYVVSGHLACQGCGATLAMRYTLKALGPRTAYTIPACCWSVIDGPFPYSSLKIPLFHTAFETAASMASGIKAGLTMMGKGDTTMVAWAGDGGTADIGIQALSGAAERNEDIIYICYDNEAYMNTGVQRSSSTPIGAWTTTTPPPHHKNRPKKNVAEIMVAHHIPYVATGCIAYPEDWIKKVSKAKEIKGTRYLQILSTCPPGWRHESEISIEIMRLAVETRKWILYEVENGKYNITKKIAKFVPVKEYLMKQGRFSHLTEEEIDKIQYDIEIEWDRMCKLSGIENKFADRL